MKNEERTFTVIIEPGEDHGFTVTCPALPGLVTEGRTLEEAREMAREAIVCCLESLQKAGLPLPTEKMEPRAETVTVSIGAA